jgi:hypothetical protein
MIASTIGSSLLTFPENFTEILGDFKTQPAANPNPKPREHPKTQTTNFAGFSTRKNHSNLEIELSQELDVTLLSEAKNS